MDNAIGGRRVLAVVPAYNERDNIVSTIEDLRTNAPGVDYVIVNDGSKDDTLAICREHGYNVIDLPVNLGLAGAFQTGMRYAYEQDYDYAVQFDADGQHSAAYIEDMVALAERNHVNIVIGSRFASTKKPFSARMMGSVLITAMILVTTRKRWGYKVEEIQVEMRERTAGESYLNFTKSVAYMLRMSISILFVQWFRRKK